MSKGSGNTRGSGANRTSLNSRGDITTEFNRNYLFNNPSIREAIQKKYPSVSFGSSGDSLTIVGVSGSIANRVIDSIRKEKEKMIDRDVKAIRNTAFTTEFGGQWNLSTPKADTSILVSEEPFIGKVYEISVIGSYDHNGAYDSETPRINRFSSLNAAKKAAREYLESYYIKRNK